MVHQYNRDVFVNGSYMPRALARDGPDMESYAADRVAGMLGVGVGMTFRARAHNALGSRPHTHWMQPAMPTEVPAIPRFDEVFRLHAPLVWRALRRLGVREADVEDLCQEVFVVVHRKLPDFEGRAKLSTWVYGICVRVASDHRKRAHMRHESPDAVPEGRLSAPQLNEIAHTQARALLDAVLAELDEDKRAVFVLYEIEELPMADVALAVGAPLQTAYSRLHAARKFVAESIAKRAEGGAT